MRNAMTAVIVATCLYGCGNPMGPIPGGALQGEEADWPLDWSFTDDIENVLLETGADDPYSVTVWGVYEGPHFYVAAADKDSNWAQNILAQPFIKLSIANKLYAGRAIQVLDNDEARRILLLYISKYDIGPEDQQEFMETDGLLFRLMHR